MNTIKQKDTISKLQQDFGNKVKQLRLQQNLSQDELSICSGIDRSQITKIEQGKVNVTLDTIEKLSRALKTTPSAIFEDI